MPESRLAPNGAPLGQHGENLKQTGIGTGRTRPEVEEMTMDKTIIVGVGGTGLNAIRSLRRRIVETHGALTAFPQLGFLYLDTDDAEVVITEDNRKRWEVMGVSTALSQAEYRIIEAPEIGPIIRNIQAFPQIGQWFPVDELKSIDQADEGTRGARQIRPLGRFAFTLTTGAIETDFKNLYQRLPQAAGGGKTQVIVICSLSGGTGSGMFLDLAYSIREWTAGNCETTAFLIFPELTTPRGKRYLVNAYAALLELNYFSCGNVVYKGQDRKIGFKLPQNEELATGKPFDYCYIVSPRNQVGVELALETLPDMVAHRVYLNFDSSFANDAKSLLNNGSFERGLLLEDPFTGNKHSQNFFTFGLSSIQYPIEQITELFAYRIGTDLVQAWLKPREIPGNINERVQGYLPELKLSDDFLLGNRDFFGTKKDYKGYEREFEEFVNELKRTTPQRNIVSYLTERKRLYLEQFRSVGDIKFYQDKRDNLDGAVKEIVRSLRQKLSAILADPQLGHEFACGAVEELARICTARHQSFVEELKGLPARETGSARSFNSFCIEVTKSESVLLFPEKRRKEAVVKACEALSANLSATIGARAFDFGRALLDRVLEELKTLAKSLADWVIAIEKLRDEIGEEISRRRSHMAEKMASLKDFNGAILFNQERIDSLYQSFDITGAIRHVENRLLAQADGGCLSVPSLGRQATDQVYRAALDWLTSVSRERVTDKNVADKLLEDYPKADARRTMLAENFRKAMPFLAFHEFEKHIGAGKDGVAYSGSQTTAAKLVGMLDDDGGALKSVSDLKKDIVAATGLSTSEIRKLSDAHQILMLHEVTAFPLRLIKDLKTLRDRYSEYTRNKQAIPLHIQKTFDPPLMGVFQTSAEEIRAVQEIEELFLLAWVEGKIVLERNQREDRDEVRYRYREAGVDTFESLGLTFLAALELCLADSDDSRRIKRLLADDIRKHLAAFDTPQKKKGLATRLVTHLQKLKQDSPMGEDDFNYQRFDIIRKRVVVNCALPTEMTSPGPPKQAQPNPAEQKFLELVRVSIKKTKGQLNPAIEQMLRSNQSRLGLSDEDGRRIIQAAVAELQGADGSAEYRCMYSAFLDAGEITDAERAQLIQLQVELGLTEEQVKWAEASVGTGRKSAVS
jgi:hypothetical protein